ncbi:MAG: GTPase HflX, partial [Armatimonadota bacterium]
AHSPAPRGRLIPTFMRHSALELLLRRSDFWDTLGSVMNPDNATDAGDGLAQGPERAVLVALGRPEDMQRQMAELRELARTAGADVVGELLQNRDRPHPATYLGKGKLAELEAFTCSTGADLVIVDDELTPAQARNIGDAVGGRVIDRTQLILDIFAQRARSAEGKLQVELAQLEYLLPRLVGKGLEMDRIGGGGGGEGARIGVRGPGETKLETDRRRLRHRMSVIRGRLEEVRRRRERERVERRRSGIPLAAVVGYTNAGKSTLVNALAGAHIEAADRLFQTLDPTVRRADLGDGDAVLLSDTVGFIERLPHHLVAALRATLEEVSEADLIIHVVDASHPDAAEQVAATRAVLQELDAGDKPTVIALNKCDIVPDPGDLRFLAREVGPPVFISALRGDGLDELRRRISHAIADRLIPATLQVPYDRMDLLSLVRAHGRITSTEYAGDGIIAEVEVEPPLMEKVGPYVIAES